MSFIWNQSEKFRYSLTLFICINQRALYNVNGTLNCCQNIFLNLEFCLNFWTWCYLNFWHLTICFLSKEVILDTEMEVEVTSVTPKHKNVDVLWRFVIWCVIGDSLHAKNTNHDPWHHIKDFNVWCNCRLDILFKMWTKVN